MKIKKVLVSSLIVAVIGFSIPYVNYAVDSTYEKIKVFIEAFELIKSGYVEEKQDGDLIYSAIEGMVNALDPFSQFLTKKSYERVKSDTEGEFGGVGIRIDVKDGWPIVVTPIPDTPAFKAKIYPGDRIIKIEGESTENKISEEIVDKLRGKPGTKVKITIAREPENKEDDWNIFDVELTRAIIKVEAINYKMVDSEIGIIRIIEFSGHAVEDFQKALKDLYSKGMKKLIIDLRYNPGGLLVASIDIAKMFLDGNKMIVYTKGRTEKEYSEYKAGDFAKYSDIPIAVLVNRYSASASEILAGALKDNKRAVIVGENTFGKASVQTIMPLSDGSAMRLTIAKYYTPSGLMIQRDPKTGKGGIVPDYEVKLTKDEEKKLYEDMQEIYYPDKNKTEKKEIKDKVLDKAMEILKTPEAKK
ncbi:MAG: S41 family peptidase [Elusimicrobiales bacterium]|jgi:carboxyl-terminal processing protease